MVAINFRESLYKRILLAIASIAGLTVVYLLQNFNYLHFISGSADFHPNFVFAFNRIIRFIINDLLAILLIWAVFYERKYVIVAFLVQVFGLLIIMPAYLFIKLSLEGDTEISSPLLSFLHRLIVHPFLILLLIPAFLIQGKQFNQPNRKFN